MARDLTLTITHQLTSIPMPCGHLIFVTKSYERQRRDDHGWFYCICGQPARFTGNNEADRLRGQLQTARDQLDTARQQRDLAEHRRRGEKAAKTRLKNRIGKGVCPCCKRTFQNLQQHMANQHPQFSDTD